MRQPLAIEKREEQWRTSRRGIPSRSPGSLEKASHNCQRGQSGHLWLQDAVNSRVGNVMDERWWRCSQATRFPGGRPGTPRRRSALSHPPEQIDEFDPNHGHPLEESHLNLLIGAVPDGIASSGGSCIAHAPGRKDADQPGSTSRCAFLRAITVSRPGGPRQRP
jgi:hypothetical protein